MAKEKSVCAGVALLLVTACGADGERSNGASDPASTVASVPTRPEGASILPAVAPENPTASVVASTAPPLGAVPVVPVETPAIPPAGPDLPDPPAEAVMPTSVPVAPMTPSPVEVDGMAVAAPTVPSERPRNEIAQTTFEDPFGPDAEWNYVRDAGWCEGPTWVPEENGFVFYAGGDRLQLWKLGEDRHSEWVQFPRNMRNHGNHYHAGIVYAANRTPGEIGRVRVSDKFYDAVPFNSEATEEFSGQVLDLANDLDRFMDGSIYFSEFAAARPRANHVGKSIYRLHTDGRLERIIDDNGSPNGVQFSPDCRNLYTTHGGAVHKWDVDDEGNISNRRNLGGDGANGIAVDSEGNVYGSGNGIRVWNKDGEEVMSWGRMRAINMAFGGPEHKTMFVTTNQGYGWINMRVAGAECSGLGTTAP